MNTYIEASAAKARIEAALEESSKALRAISGGGDMGLTPDHVKATLAWRAARARYDLTHSQLRAFNGWFLKTFAKEEKARRAAVHAQRIAALK